MCVGAFATWPAFLQSAENGRMAAAVPNALKAHSENLGRPWELKWVRIKLIPFGRKARIMEDEPLSRADADARSSSYDVRIGGGRGVMEKWT